MRDKRPVDELSIEELEKIIAIKRREDRQEKLKRMQRSGRTLDAPPEPVEVKPSQNRGKQHPSQDAILSAAASSAMALAPAREHGKAPQFEDAPDDERVSDPDRDRFWKGFVSQALLLVEVVAVLGLVYLGYTMFQSIGQLETETAAAQRMADENRLAALPTIAPTPQLRLEQIVLPGGHTPPTSPGGAQFNLNEIPANLLPAVQSQIFQPIINRPQQTEQTALRLIVPRLNLDQTIVQGTDWEALKQGIGQLQNAVNPGDERGNLVLSGHNDIYGELFRHLDQLEVGDRFQVQTRTEVFTYVVSGWEIVEPTDVHVLNERGAATATLISCYPYQVNNKRIVVFADQVNN